MNAGTLRHKIDIQQYTPTRNAVGEEIKNWSTLYTVNAAIIPVSGKEYFSNQSINAEISHKINIRYKSGLTPKMRIKYGDRYFNIKSIIDWEERHIELQLMCSEVI